MKHNRVGRLAKARVSPSVLERINLNVAGHRLRIGRAFRGGAPRIAIRRRCRSFKTFTGESVATGGLADRVSA